MEDKGGQGSQEEEGERRRGGGGGSSHVRFQSTVREHVGWGLLSLSLVEGVSGTDKPGYSSPGEREGEGER